MARLAAKRTSVQTFFSLLSRIIVSALFVLAGVKLASSIVAEPEPHRFLNMKSEGIWTNVPVQVDPSLQAFQRLPTQPAPFSLKLRAGPTFRVLDSASFQIDGVRYKLVGAPDVDRKKVCTSADGKKYACGLNALKALDNAIRGRSIECALTGAMGDDQLAQCRVNGQGVLSLL